MLVHVADGHPQLWAAIATLATAAAGALRHGRKRTRKLERDVDVLKMQLEIHRQILITHGFSVPTTDAPRSDL